MDARRRVMQVIWDWALVPAAVAVAIVAAMLALSRCGAHHTTATETSAGKSPARSLL